MIVLTGLNVLLGTSWPRKGRLVKALGRAIASVDFVETLRDSAISMRAWMALAASSFALLSLMTSCGSSRTATSVSSRDRVATYETRDSVEVVERSQQDSLVEVTTITIDRNDAGDTVKVVQITDRTRARDRDKIAKQMTKMVVKMDTVFIERRDSVEVSGFKIQNSVSKRTSGFVSALKWIFAIVIGLIVLIMLLKIKL